MKIIVTETCLSSSQIADIKLAHEQNRSLPHGARYTDKAGPDDMYILHVAPVSNAVPDLLIAMADTYRERNAVYGDNWRNVGNVMMALYPDGIKLSTAEQFNMWHLFELIVVKLTRFANSKLSHADSIHDIAVYAAMLEAAIKEKEGR